MPPPPSDGARTRVGYLGPEGTFSEEALLASVDSDAVEPVPLETIYDALIAVRDGAVEWVLVPIENSIEGSVTVTLDTLSDVAHDVAIVGEVVLPVRHCLIAREAISPAEIHTVVSHPHVPGQCRRFLHEELLHARVVPASSTAEAVRIVSEHDARDWAAIGTRLAAEIHRCTVLYDGIQDRTDNETRFVWLAGESGRAGPPPLRAPAAAGRKTSLVFWGAGADRAGWLVQCLNEFARREINLTKIESRPRRERLGHYMFFVDLDGDLTRESVSDAIEGLRAPCEEVLVLGSYATA
jgi:prephenate dehydratase